MFVLDKTTQPSLQMLERKKAEGRKRRKKKDIDLINDNDDAIAKMIADMRLAAREDRDLNIARYSGDLNAGIIRFSIYSGDLNT